MPTVIKLHNGDSIDTDEGPQELANRFDASRRDGTLTKVETEGEPVWINPHVLATIQHREAFSRAASS
jgi:hypothetical protein